MGYDYGKIYDARFTILRKAFQKGYPRDREAVDAFRRENKWLENYALYMAVKSRVGLTAQGADAMGGGERGDGQKDAAAAVHEAVDAFRRENKWLENYALYMAVKSHFGMKSWLVGGVHGHIDGHVADDLDVQGVDIVPQGVPLLEEEVLQGGRPAGPCRPGCGGLGDPAPLCGLREDL